MPAAKEATGLAVNTAPKPQPDWRHFDPLPLDNVLEAAAEAFVELGYHGATVREIARRCGLSVPGMYHHYVTKQEMLVALLDMLMEDLLWRTGAARAGGGADPVRRFALIVECLALVHTHRRDLAFIGASEMRSLEAANRDRIVGLRVKEQRLLDAEVVAAVASGEFTTSHPHEASRAVATMCTAIVQWYQPGGPDSPEMIAERYVEFAFGLVGYRPAPRRDRRRA